MIYEFRQNIPSVVSQAKRDGDNPNSLAAY
jgi:hypothetical protein